MERQVNCNITDLHCMLTMIDGELNKEDLEHLVFLCESHLNTSTQQSIKTGCQLFEILERKGLISEQNVKLLNILFRIIGRMDLLEMLPPDNSDMENDSSGDMMTLMDEYVCRFSRVLFYINEELVQDEVDKLRYAYGEVPRNVQISSGLHLFKIMRKKKAIGPENLEYLKSLLKTIDRNDLVALVEDYSRHSSEARLSNLSLGAGDSAIVQGPACQSVNKTSLASNQSCYLNSPISQCEEQSFVQQKAQSFVQQKQVMPVAPLRPEAAPLSLAKAPPDNHHSGPLGHGAVPFSCVQASAEDQNTEQTSVKSLPQSRNRREVEFSQRLCTEQTSIVKTAEEVKTRPVPFLSSMSVPSGTPYSGSVSPGLKWMTSTSHENLTASTGEAAQVAEEMDQTEICDDRYKMTAEPRGLCLVIDNDTFEASNPGAENLLPRKGSNIDAENLKQCFDMLKFDVRVLKNLTLEQTRDCLEGFSKFNHLPNDCFVCCILSHGCEGAIYCSDCLKMDVKELTSYFSPKHCPSLGGKPKLFFLSCCQGKTKPDAVQIERDGPPSETDLLSSEVADFLIGYATMFGYAAFRDTNKGTIYIQSLTGILKKYYKTKHLLDMLVMVNADISSKTLSMYGKDYKQVGAPQVTLRKQVWF